MIIYSEFECKKIEIKKMKQYGILMPKEEIGEEYFCIPLVEGMELKINNWAGKITGEYEILYREVLPRGNAGVIRLPKEYQSCDVLLLK